MSFLKQLQDKKRTLKNATTLITYQDGRRFIQEGNKLEQTLEYPSTLGFVVDNKPDDTPAFVIDRIYLGSQDCCQLNILQKYNITRVLSVGIPAPCSYPNIAYKYVRCLDLPETNIEATFEDCFEFLDASVGENILVHCNAGVSRSPSVVIGYLIRKRRFSFDEAYGLVKSARPAVQPNVGFVKQLKLLTNYNNE